MNAAVIAFAITLCTAALYTSLAVQAQGRPPAQRAPAAQPETPEEELFRAIREGKGVFAEGLVVDKKVNVNARNAEGETPLHRAVERGMPRLTKLLIDAGANVRARSKHGETPLHLAALHADPILVEMLLAAGADPNARNDSGESVLYWAALTGNTDTARVLVEHGADPDVTDLEGNGPLHGAADGGHIDTVRYLVKVCAEPQGKNRAGQTPGDIARARGYKTIAEIVDDAVPGTPPGSGGPGFRTLYDDEDKPKPTSPRRP
jgi:ankyrin repeat protein